MIVFSGLFLYQLSSATPGSLRSSKPRSPGIPSWVSAIMASTHSSRAAATQALLYVIHVTENGKARTVITGLAWGMHGCEKAFLGEIPGHSRPDESRWQIAIVSKRVAFVPPDSRESSEPNLFLLASEPLFCRPIILRLVCGRSYRISQLQSCLHHDIFRGTRIALFAV
jgi:hypothetical protein